MIIFTFLDTSPVFVVDYSSILIDVYLFFLSGSYSILNHRLSTQVRIHK